jgi:hypothetical protein
MLIKLQEKKIWLQAYTVGADQLQKKKVGLQAREGRC